VKHFISYIANKERSFLHIKEAITKNHELATIIRARFGIEKEDLIVDCWVNIWEDPNEKRVDYIFHRNRYCDVLVSSRLQDRQTRKTTSVAVYYFLMEIYGSEKKKKLVRLHQGVKMEETIKQLFENSVHNDSPDDILILSEETKASYLEKTLCALSEAGLKPEHMVLLNWQIGIIDEDEAMEILGVSRRTLFNRWNKIKPEIIKAYYKPIPRKIN
jgi:hypothetical protein